MSKPHFIFANVKFRSDVVECEKNFATRTKRGKTRDNHSLPGKPWKLSFLKVSLFYHPRLKYSHEHP